MVLSVALVRLREMWGGEVNLMDHLRASNRSLVQSACFHYRKNRKRIVALHIDDAALLLIL